MFRFTTRTFVLASILALSVGCGGAYSAAISRGDDFAKAGHWDKAAAEYEAAIKLDPTEPEAQIKLREVKRKMSGERLSRGRSLLARGEIAAGLASIVEASKLDPDSAEVQKALTDANAKALAKADELLEADEGRKAFELTTLVLSGAPNHPKGKEVDGRVRDRLADQSYARAEAFLTKGKLGNAFMEFAACTSYRAGFKDAKLRVGQVKLQLEQELTFWVVLDKFADSGGGLSVTLSPELLGQSFDGKLPLRVVAQPPSAASTPTPLAGKGKDPKDAAGPAAAASLRGVRLAGKFDGYRFAHDNNKVGRSCDYVCGKDFNPNPAYAAAEQTVASAERDQERADGEAARAQTEVDRHQRDVEVVQRDVDRAQSDAERARDDLEKCQSREKPGDSSSSSCSSERNRMESARSSVENARRRLSSPQSSLDSARGRLDTARDQSNRARESKARATETMRTTPKMIEVPRHCAHNYQVDVHTVRAQVTVVLTAASLEDGAKVLDAVPFEYKIDKRDETFEAQPNRCAEVAGGDPLKLPTEKDVKTELVTKTIAGVREKVLSTYDRYRQRFLADARREEAAGLTDEAVEAYVRYLLTGPKKLDAKDQKQIAEFLSKTRGFGKIELIGSL